MTKTKKNAEFRPNDFVVYPAHGVGRIVSIDEQEVAGIKMEMFVITFEKDKMTLRVPTHKAASVGMRSLSSPDIVGKAMETLKGRARVKRAGSSGPTCDTYHIAARFWMLWYINTSASRISPLRGSATCGPCAFSTVDGNHRTTE